MDEIAANEDKVWLDEATRLSRPRDAGRWARIVGEQDITANPYKSGTLKWTHWRDAWNKADREMRHLGHPLKRGEPKDIPFILTIEGELPKPDFPEVKPGDVCEIKLGEDSDYKIIFTF